MQQVLKQYRSIYEFPEEGFYKNITHTKLNTLGKTAEDLYEEYKDTYESYPAGFHSDYADFSFTTAFCDFLVSVGFSNVETTISSLTFYEEFKKVAKKHKKLFKKLRQSGLDLMFFEEEKNLYYFENEEFFFIPDYSILDDDDNLSLMPSFIHKPTGYAIWISEKITKQYEHNCDIDLNTFQNILESCKYSLIK